MKLGEHLITPKYREMEPSEDDVIDEQKEHKEPEESVYDPDLYPGGADSYAMPDEAPRVELISAITTAIREEIDRERKFYNEIGKEELRVNTNLSGSVQFQRYSLAANQPTQICREKRLRGDITIVNLTDTVSVSIGLHTGIRPQGTDTVEIVGTTTGSARVIRTRLALWAVSDTACTIDVQEEYD